MIYATGIRVSRWPLSDGGLYLDREWALVSVATGKVLTQKAYPKLALCRPRLSGGGEREDWGADAGGAAGFIMFRAPGMEETLAVEVHPSCGRTGAGETTTGGHDALGGASSVHICNQERPAEPYRISKYSTGEKITTDANSWFSRFLGEAVRVLRRAEGDTEFVANFSNEAQFLMITEPSLTKLAKVLK